MFSLSSAVDACTILERTSGFDPSSYSIAPRYLKFLGVYNSFPLTCICPCMPLPVMSFVLSAIIST